MATLDTDFIKDVQHLENVIFVCFGKPKGDELPQAANHDDMIIDMIHNRTGKPLELIDAEIHNQVPHPGEKK